MSYFQKSIGFLTFSRGIEMRHWHEKCWFIREQKIFVHYLLNKLTDLLDLLSKNTHQINIKSKTRGLFKIERFIFIQMNRSVLFLKYSKWSKYLKEVMVPVLMLSWPPLKGFYSNLSTVLILFQFIYCLPSVVLVLYC